jgi:hypothetical protein
MGRPAMGKIAAHPVSNRRTTAVFMRIPTAIAGFVKD